MNHPLTRWDNIFSDPFFANAPSSLGILTSRRPEKIWQPSVDVRETDETFDISIEVPGVEPEQIDASISGNTLTIKGEKSRELRQTDEAGRDRRIERSYGSFSRSIRLPANVDPESVAASSKHGVLMISLKKRDTTKKIDISLN